MSRPPRNGYTINSDAELSVLDSSLIPANTPLINFDRKCWGVYNTGDVLTPVLWTPENTTTAIWLDAADASTITESSGLVSQWNDKSGNGRHVSQASSALSPAYTANSLNGLAGINFNANKGLQRASSAVIQFVLVVTKSASTTWQDYHTHLDSGNGLSRFGGLREVSDTGFHNNVLPNAVWEDGVSKTVSTTGFTSVQDPHIIGYTAASGRGNPSPSLIIGNYELGGSFGGCGTEYEIIGLSVVPTEEIRQKLEGYVAHKWGLTANLASDHPYKIEPPTTGEFTISAIEDSLSITSGFEYIPQNSINAYALTSITISTDTYSLDLSTVTQYLSITLATNTTLTVLNADKYIKHFIELIPNGHIIKNFTDIFSLPRQYNQATLLTAYFGKQVLELQYINKLYANIDYSDNITPAGTVATVQKINWESPSEEVLYLAFGSSTTEYTGAGISSVSATVGTPTISKSRLLLGSTGRLEATKTSTLDFNETDFTISFFSAKTSIGEYGCILGSHKASSIGFYVGVAADSTLFAVFGSNTLSCTFPDDINEHSVIINRIGRVYKIFIDGVLSAYLKAANNFNNNSTEPLCIGSLKNATGTPSWTSQSWQGYLRQLTINTSASIPFSANDVPPKDTLTASTVLLLKYNVSDTEFSQYNLARSFTSNTTVEPLIASGRLNKYSHIGYADSNLEITGDVTLEAKIFNSSGNTRGAIIDVEGGFTWGIYDLKLRIAFGSFTLDGVTDIPDSTVVDVAFVKSGTSCSLFLDGELEATATTSEVMNTASSGSEFSIKRTFTQDSSVASLNTSLFRSRSWIEIAQLRVTKSARYTGNYIPDFSYGQ